MRCCCFCWGVTSPHRSSNMRPLFKLRTDRWVLLLAGLLTFVVFLTWCWHSAVWVRRAAVHLPLPLAVDLLALLFAATRLAFCIADTFTVACWSLRLYQCVHCRWAYLGMVAVGPQQLLQQGSCNLGLLSLNPLLLLTPLSPCSALHGFLAA